MHFRSAIIVLKEEEGRGGHTVSAPAVCKRMHIWLTCVLCLSLGMMHASPP